MKGKVVSFYNQWKEGERYNVGESKFAKCNLVEKIKGNLDARMVAYVMHPFTTT